jgi:hypothetical protein
MKKHPGLSEPRTAIDGKGNASSLLQHHWVVARWDERAKEIHGRSSPEFFVEGLIAVAAKDP